MTLNQVVDALLIAVVLAATPRAMRAQRFGARYLEEARRRGLGR